MPKISPKRPFGCVTPAALHRAGSPSVVGGSGSGCSLLRSRRTSLLPWPKMPGVRPRASACAAASAISFSYSASTGWTRPKGLPQRLAGYRRLLETRPEIHRRVAFLQIAAESRKDVVAYQDLRNEVEREAGGINSLFSEADWTPLRLIARAGARGTMAGYMREARVGLVTPLRGRHEPCRQGIYRGAGSTRPRRAGPVTLCWRGANSLTPLCWSTPTTSTNSPTQSSVLSRWDLRNGLRVGEQGGTSSKTRLRLAGDGHSWPHSFAPQLPKPRGSE